MELFLALISPVLIFLLTKPLYVVLIVLSFGFVNTSIIPPVIEIGEFSTRYVDLCFVLLVVSIIMKSCVTRHLFVTKGYIRIFLPIIIFIIYIGISLSNVQIFSPDSLSASIASYLRLLTTVIFSLLIHLSLVRKKDLDIIHRGVLLLCISSISMSIVWIFLGFETNDIDISGRFGAFLGINYLGLVSGLIVLYAWMNRKHSEINIHCIWIGLLGIMGLYLSKSAGANLSTAIVITIYEILWKSRKTNPITVIKYGIIGLIVIVLASSTIWWWRQSDITGLFSLTGGSFAHRLMIAYAGGKLFLEYPLFGTGWQASSSGSIAGSLMFNKELMDKFQDLPMDYFFLERQTSLHNMYIQFLVELGVIGFILFIFVCLRVRKSIMLVVNNHSNGNSQIEIIKFYSMGLIFLLLWWNTNPLFGGQTESILMFTFLAIIASVDKVDRNREEDL